MASKSDVARQAINKTVEQLSGEKRPIYFPGKVLTESDLRAEQVYFLRKLQRHNRLLHGWGVVEGLGLTIKGTGTRTSVVLASGYAIDRQGNELILNTPVSVAVDNIPSPSYVVLEYIERPTDIVSAVVGDEGTQASFSAEGVAVSFAVVLSDGLALGRLLRKGLGWKIDSAFKPHRIK